MSKAKRCFLYTAALALSSLAASGQNATVTANVKMLSGGAALPTGNSVRVDLQNCTAPRVPGTGNIVSKSQTFYPNTSGIANITLFSNSVIDCGAGVLTNPVSFYTFNLVSNGQVTSLGSYKVPAGSSTLDTLTPINTTPVINTPTGDSTYLRLDLGNWGDLVTPLPPISTSSLNAVGAVTSGSVATPVVNSVLYSQSGDTIASIESACSSACTYMVTTPQTITLGASHTLSNNVNLQFANSGSWTVNGSPLTIPGHVDGTLNQHFSGSSAVKFGLMQQYVPVEWFGAVGDWNGSSGTDNTSALQSALNSLTAGQIQLQGQYYKTTSALSITASSVGIKGTVGGGVNFQFSSQPYSSGIITTNASADVIDVVGSSASADIYYNCFNDFAIARSVVPSGTATGLSVNHAKGTVVDRVQSMDSMRDFYFHDASSFGTGLVTRTWATWGFNGVTETAGQNLSGYYLDSADGEAENSLIIQNSTANTSLPATVLTHGMDIIGTHINDVNVFMFGTSGLVIGENVDYTGTGNLGETADIHFKEVVNDEYWQNGIVLTNILASGTALGSVTVEDGWNVSFQTGATASIALNNSSGILIEGVQIVNMATGSCAVAFTSTNSSIFSNNQILAGSATGAAVCLSTSTVNAIHGNAIRTSGGKGLWLTNSSSHNAIGGNTFTMNGGSSIGLLFDATSVFNIGAYDNAFDGAVTTPFSDAAGSNLGVFPGNITVEGGTLTSSLGIIGTAYTASGGSCGTITAITGGATGGSFKSGVTGTCTSNITIGAGTPGAAHGWILAGLHNLTTPADACTQTNSSTSTASLSCASTSGDVIQFIMVAY